MKVAHLYEVLPSQKDCPKGSVALCGHKLKRRRKFVKEPEVVCGRCYKLSRNWKPELR